jgi:hypothetical protein
MQGPMAGIVRRWLWIGALAALVAVGTADWVATATVPEMWTTTESGYGRVEFAYAPPFATADWWLLTAPRLAIPFCVVVALWSAQRHRRAAVGCALAGIALVAMVLVHVAATEALALRAGVFAAEAAVLIAVVAVIISGRRG